jgi:hypothetical protein
MIHIYLLPFGSRNTQKKHHNEGKFPYKLLRTIFSLFLLFLDKIDQFFPAKIYFWGKLFGRKFGYLTTVVLYNFQRAIYV